MQHSDRIKKKSEPIWPLANPWTHCNSHQAGMEPFRGQRPFKDSVAGSEHWGDKDLEDRASARAHTERWRKGGPHVSDSNLTALICCPCSCNFYFTHIHSVRYHISQFLCMCVVSGMRAVCVVRCVFTCVCGICVGLWCGWLVCIGESVRAEKGVCDWIPGFRIP